MSIELIDINFWAGRMSLVIVLLGIFIFFCNVMWSGTITKPHDEKPSHRYSFRSVSFIFIYNAMESIFHQHYITLHISVTKKTFWAFLFLVIVYV